MAWHPDRESPRDRRVVLGLSAVLMVLIGWLDWLNGVEMSLLTFYWIPVACSTWYLDRIWGLGFAAASVGVAVSTDLAGGMVYAHPGFIFWDLGSRILSFVIFVWLLDRLRLAFSREKEASEQSRRLAALKGDLVNLVSHEFINSVTLIKLSLEGIEGAEGSSTAHSREIIARAVQNVYRTATNFLNEARMESGKFKLEPRPLELRPCVEGAARLFEPTAAARGIALRVEGGEGLRVEADEAALVLIVNNLLGNALKFSESGGRVEVTMARTPGGRAQVCVADTGIGMKPEEIGKLAEAFVRLPAGQMMASGFGIGLKVASDLARMHGGSLEIESEPGKGTRFRFSLRLASEAGAASAQAASSPDIDQVAAGR
ncbi:MAG: HAMP domain-containing sensor histidine kinase [Elusimicrobia bacterium]|nr:HAMP domain-containing sensor histidine kinase [Elusimicrobiota bacterium]